MAKKTIWIIDDDPDEEEIFCAALNQVDIAADCIFRHSCEEAIEKIEDLPGKLPDFIFLDLNLPVMDGKKCIIAIKNNSLLKKIPVIIYTTSASRIEMEKLKDLGAVHFITKPSSFTELCEKIRFVIIG